jgi:hypothetical protein
VTTPVPTPLLFSFFPQLTDGGELRGEHRKLALDGGELLLVLGLGARFSYFYFFFIAASVSAFKLKR